MKLYVVTRQDLSPGQQIAQSAHAVAEWCLQCPKDAALWNEKSNTIICLSVPTEYDLRQSYEYVADYVRPVLFKEPDFFDEWTAFAVGLSAYAWILKSFPLAGESTGSLLKEAAKREAARNFQNGLTTNNIQR